MKLRSLYSNDSVRFPRIDFHDGLNVIFARVEDPTLANQDSHNLGKTFLIRVLDFACLGGVDRNHPFKVHADLFEDFVFFIELETNQGQFVTVRRAVSGRKSICINVATSPGQDYSSLPVKDWLHCELGKEGARQKLDSLLDLSAIRPYDFRKGLGYFLRRQADYDNEFLISRFGRGKDRDWKPFMALMLGFDHTLVATKYELDKRQEEINTTVRELESAAGRKSEEFDELRGVLEIREREVNDLRARVNSFDFAEIESEITRETVRDIESRIADLNEQSYGLQQERSEIERALQADFGFNVEELRDVFAEAEIALPGELLRSYEDLVAFNERISTARKSRLRERMQYIFTELSRLADSAGSLNEQRVSALEVVTSRETLVKFQSLQRDLLEQEEQLVRVRAQLQQADKATDLRQELRRLEEERNRVVDDIMAMIRAGSETYTIIRTLFAQYAKAILHSPAIMSVTLNQQGNMEFGTRVIDKNISSRETDEGEGTSWKKVLCACFDLALLSGWSGSSFYRFVYHDGVFEGLDDRRKVSLLATIRSACEEYNLQYVLTVIDSDLPRDEEDSKLLFSQDEVVRELHDGGDDGRLFRMGTF